MSWWIWLVLGLALIVFEALLPSGLFVAMFLGAGAGVVGLTLLAGVALPVWAQWLLWPVVSVAALLLFRGRLQARLQARPQHKVDNLADEVAVGVAEVAPGAVGQVELRGTVWTARNDGQETIRTGQRCRVVRVDGLTLHVVSES